MGRELSASTVVIPSELLAIMICFAANSVLTRYLVANDLVPPFTLTVIRFVSGFIMLVVLAAAVPRVFRREKLTWPYVVGAVSLGVYAFSISFGYDFITAGAGVLVFYTFVIVTMTAYSIYVDKEKLTARLLSGQALGIAGVAVITFGGISDVTALGTLLMAVTGTAWGVHSVYCRRFTSSFGYTYNSFLLFGLAAAVLFAAAYPIQGSQLWAGMTTVSLGWALVLGMITTALSYALWHSVLTKISASQGGVSQLLVPVIGVIMGVLLLGEQVTISLAVGGAMILAGIFLNTF